jgi:hypothetical protein
VVLLSSRLRINDLAILIHNQVGGNSVNVEGVFECGNFISVGSDERDSFILAGILNVGIHLFAALERRVEEFNKAAV